MIVGVRVYVRLVWCACRSRGAYPRDAAAARLGARDHAVLPDGRGARALGDGGGGGGRRGGGDRAAADGLLAEPEAPAFLLRPDLVEGETAKLLTMVCGTPRPRVL